MSDQRLNNENMLIDYVVGRCDGESGGHVKKLLEQDKSLLQVHQDITNTVAALKLSVDVEPPADLLQKTLKHIEAAQLTNKLIASQEIRRTIPLPTFSLRELAGIAAAIVLLATVFVPLLRQGYFVSQQKQCQANTRQIGTAFASYASANNGILPGAYGLGSRWLPGDSEAAVSNSSGLFHLIRNGYAKPEVFQCPSVGGSSFIAQAGMVDFPTKKNISYSYQHSLGNRPLSNNTAQLVNMTDKMAILADATPVFGDQCFLPNRVLAQTSDNHHRRGQNVLYLDSHADWADQACVGVNGDNIYLAQGVLQYRGKEAPAGPTDSFLLPAYVAPTR